MSDSNPSLPSQTAIPSAHWHDRTAGSGPRGPEATPPSGETLAASGKVWAGLLIAPSVIAVAIAIAVFSGGPPLRSDAKTLPPAVSPPTDVPSGALVTAGAERDAASADAGEPTQEVALANVVVSIGFDDGFASQSLFLDMVEELGAPELRATFYINSSRINLEQNERESRDLARYAPLHVWRRAQRQGHEIGSHSVSHFDLSCTPERHGAGECQAGHVPLTASERRRQVCADRQMLASLGFDVRGFAYPFGRDRSAPEDPTLHDLAARCGFEYARRANGLVRGSEGGDGDLAESIPPADPYAIRSYGSVTRDVTFADIRRWIVDAARHGGGWVPLIFHHVSDDCSVAGQGDQELGVCVLTGELEALVRWLGRTGPEEGAPEVVQVLTMGEVVRGLGSASLALVANAGLEQPHSGTIARPNCYDRFGGKHETNFEWSSRSLEQDRLTEGQFGDPTDVEGSFEKLIPTARYPHPMVRMTTRDDNCYLPVRPDGRYRVRLRARARSSDGQTVSGRVVFRRLTLSRDGENEEPRWLDWPVQVPHHDLTTQWRPYFVDVPQLPPDTVALAWGYEYVGPEPTSDAAHEVWIDDLNVAEYAPHSSPAELE